MRRPQQELLAPAGVNVLGGMPYSSSNAEARYNEHLRRIKFGGGCGASVTTFLVMDYVEQIRLIDLKRNIVYFSKGPKSNRTDRTQKRRSFRVNLI